MFMGIVKRYLFSTLLIAVIGNVHQGTLRERIDRAFHNRVDNLVFSIILRGTRIYGDFLET